jgi:flagellar protein FlaG
MMVEAAAYTNPILAIAEPVSSPKKISSNDLSRDGNSKAGDLIYFKDEVNGHNDLYTAFADTDSSQDAGRDTYSSQEGAPEMDLEGHALRVHFKSNQETGRVAISVINAETDEIIREIPSEEVLRISEKIQKNIGLIFDQNM